MAKGTSKRIQPGIWGRRMHIKPLPENVWREASKYNNMVGDTLWGRKANRASFKDHVQLPGQCGPLISPRLVLVIPDSGFSVFGQAVLFSLLMTLVIFHLALLFCLPFAANLIHLSWLFFWSNFHSYSIFLLSWFKGPLSWQRDRIWEYWQVDMVSRAAWP